MSIIDVEIQRLHALRTIQSCVLRLKWLAAATRFEIAMHRHDRALKAGFNLEQPRDEIGRWTDANGNVVARRQVRTAGKIPTSGVPKIPKERPATSAERTAVLKRVARRLGPLMTVAEAAWAVGSWVHEYHAKIDSYRDPPKSMEELQDAVSPTSKAGYQDHHIVEQASARARGYSEDLIDGRDNVVRIPTMRHEDINGWYQRPIPTYNWKSPREYLRDKSWDERRAVGLKALIENKVLKP